MKIKLLDLFSGIGGFHKGLEQAGFEVKSYFSEIDKYAIQVYKHNFKKSKYVGSVTDVYGGNLPKIDAITFGSPCQDFSIAGKRKGMEGDRSSLIGEAIRLISECRPKFFVWENVKGTFSSNNGEDFWAIIQAFVNIGGYRLEWQLLNTKWFLPQNRERIYLVGYLGNGGRGQVFPIRENKRKIDVLQGQQGNTNCITARYDGLGNGSYIIERQFNAQEAMISNASPREFGFKNYSPSLLSRDYKDPKIVKIKSNTKNGFEIAEEEVEIGTLRTHNDGKGFRKVKDGNCPTIPARAREDGSGQPIIKIKSNLQEEVKILGYTRDSKGNVIKRNEKDEANTLHSSSGSGGNTDQYVKIKSNTKIRRLTPIECERLQGFPDNWTQQGTEGLISDTQRYKMCGNAVTVDVVQAVAERIKNIL